MQGQSSSRPPLTKATEKTNEAAQCRLAQRTNSIEEEHTQGLCAVLSAGTLNTYTTTRTDSVFGAKAAQNREEPERNLAPAVRLSSLPKSISQLVARPVSID